MEQPPQQPPQPQQPYPQQPVTQNPSPQQPIPQQPVPQQPVPQQLVPQQPVQAQPTPPRPMPGQPVDPNHYDQFVLRQKWAMVVNRYYFYLAGDEENPFCFVQQKRFKFKEDIRFYTDESKSVELMRIKARQRFDPRATYDITDADGAVIGKIKKLFGKSLLRSSFAIYDPWEREVAIAREAHLGVALFRRLAGFIPYLGDFAEWLPIPYDFEFLRGEYRLGMNRRRRWKFVDKYDIDFTPDPQRTVDRRLVLAATVGMDALQAR